MWIEGAVSEQKNIKSFDLIDIVKFVGAFLVIAGHTNPISSFSETANYIILDCISRTMLPIYFMTSGFLLFRKVDPGSPNLSYCVRYALKILKIYIIWTILYIPIICYSVYIDNGGIIEGIKNQLKAFLFVGSATQLWYLNSLVYCVLLIAAMLYFKAGKYTILTVSAVLYICGLIISDNYFFSSILPKDSAAAEILKAVFKFKYLPKRALTNAFFCISLGMVLAWSKRELSKKKAYLLALAALVLYAAEALIPYFRYDNASFSFFFIVIFAYALCNIFIRTPIPHKAKYTWYRNMSSMIFYVHIFILTFFNKAMEYLEAATGLNVTNGLVLFTGTTVISFAVSALILKLSEKERFAFLKVLYTGSFRSSKAKAA